MVTNRFASHWKTGLHSWDRPHAAISIVTGGPGSAANDSLTAPILSSLLPAPPARPRGGQPCTAVIQMSPEPHSLRSVQARSARTDRWAHAEDHSWPTRLRLPSPTSQTAQVRMLAHVGADGGRIQDLLGLEYARAQRDRGIVR